METIGSLWSLWVTRFPHTLGMTFIQIRNHEEFKIIGGLCGVTIIPKSCHHHVIRPLTYMFPLNPNI